MVLIPLQRASDVFASSFYDHQLTHLLLQAFGGCIPEGPDALDQVQRVLNRGCGSGAWTIACGHAHPYLHIVGLDSNPALIEHARQTAQRECLPHVHHHHLPDDIALFPFLDRSFDLIYMQQYGLLNQSGGFAFDEYWRLLRPGGRLCIVAWELPLTNALAWEELADLTLKAFSTDEHRIAAFGRHAGLLCELESLCRDAGFSDCTMQLCSINFSYALSDHLGWAHALLPSPGTQRRLIERGLITPMQLDALIERQQQEMRSPVFQGLLPIAVLWGTKPQ